MKLLETEKFVVTTPSLGLRFHVYVRSYDARENSNGWGFRPGEFIQHLEAYEAEHNFETDTWTDGTFYAEAKSADELRMKLLAHPDELRDSVRQWGYAAITAAEQDLEDLFAKFKCECHWHDYWNTEVDYYIDVYEWCAPKDEQQRAQIVEQMGAIEKKHSSSLVRLHIGLA